MGIFFSYLNMYQPVKKVQKQIDRLRLEMLMRQPESEDERVQQPEFPDILYAENRKKMPYWQHQELLKKNVGKGIYAALYNDYVNPSMQHLNMSEKNKRKL